MLWSSSVFYLLAAGLACALTTGATVHVLLYKRRTQAAVAWIGLLWLTPYLGVTLYLLFGINRLHRKARSLRVRLGERPMAPVAMGATPDQMGELQPLASLVEKVVSLDLCAGNRVEPLDCGDEAYPAMIAAIGEARSSVAMVSYIFDNDPWGRRFAEALAAAKDRGVEVRVLIDGVGSHYTRPTIVTVLKAAGVPVARFLYSFNPRRMAFLNLRNHRKLLVVDGLTAFTGGMNIRAACVLGDKPDHPVADLHFKVEGPVVPQLLEVFASDWSFTTGEELEGPAWWVQSAMVGSVHARVIPDGPDRDMDKALWTAMGALACARKRVMVVTPYFLPDEALKAALAAAALRGVEVIVLIPERSNLPFVDWATAFELPDILEHGVQVYLGGTPFDHTKLMVVDGQWVLLGSANWDTRSMRLNFELNLECYDAELARRCEALVLSRLDRARLLDSAELEARPLVVRLRDSIARLFNPYL